jgi:adenine deaminase
MRKSSFGKMNKQLINVALGKEKADFVILNGNVVNVYSGEIQENADIALKGDRIALLGNASHAIGSKTVTADAKGKFIAPGFLDAHCHPDDSLLTLREFSAAVLPRGTTGIFADPHEIANVLGVKGIRLMLEEAKKIPIRFWITVPSCVPAVNSRLDVAGSRLSLAETKEALQWKESVALGEVMDYPGVIQGKDEILKKINACLKIGKVVEGHAPGLTGDSLNAYLAGGITSCHESTEYIEALEKLRKGMWIYAREGFAGIKNVKEIIRILTEVGVHSNRICLVTDDRHPKDILQEGHLDYAIKLVTEEGLDPVKAIRLCTINPASRFGQDNQVGGISPSKFADLVVIDDLDRFDISEVWVGGKVVARHGRIVVPIKATGYPKFAKKTMHLSQMKLEDFMIRIPKNKIGEVLGVNIITFEEGSVKTTKKTEEMKAKEGNLQPDSLEDVAKIASIERHHGSGLSALGFVRGLKCIQGLLHRP